MKYIASYSLLLLSLNFGIAQTQVKQASTQHPVYAIFMQGIADFNNHNLHAFMMQFDEDIVIYTPTGWLRNRRDVENRFSTTFQQFPKVQMEVEALNVKAVNAQTAVVDFIWHVYPHGNTIGFHGVGSGVYVRKGEQWKEVIEHETVTKTDDGTIPVKK